MRSYSDRRSRSIRQMTGTLSGGGGASPIAVGAGDGSVLGRSIASGQITQGGGMTITRRHGEHHITPSSPESSIVIVPREDPPQDDKDDNFNVSSSTGRHSYFPAPNDDLFGVEEEAITFPQSTHSWLFTQPFLSVPFWFAVGIATLSYFSLILALLNIFEDYDPGNPFKVPYQVQPIVRMAQYLAMIIALIMEEEIPTGLYLLRMISKESLHKKFPTIQFGRFFLAAMVRLLMGYLFLFNTFCVVVQASAVLDIFYDVLALQFLQQLDDIAFNLAKIDVFGKRLKHAALAKSFRVEFEKQPFVLRKRMNIFLKGVYFLNLFALLTGLSFIASCQNQGLYHSERITVTFGDQIWSDAYVTLASGQVVTRTLLFSYFNGIYARNGTDSMGRPIYTEQNKFNGEEFISTVGAEIRYCDGAWVFAHKDIRKSNRTDYADESDCPWLLRSPGTNEYNLLDVTGDWSIWTGSLQDNGHFSAVDNQCQGAVDCNYHGTCAENGQCLCAEDGGYFGTRCEHQPACSVITGGEGGSWGKVTWATSDTLIYQRPVYMYDQGLSKAYLENEGLDPDNDQVYLVYTGSRWLGIVFRGVARAAPPRSFWEGYVRDFHAFWMDTYNLQTKFTSDPTTQSSIIGIDFYRNGKRGEEYGAFGQLFPLSDPKGSGFMRCVEDTLQIYTFDINFLNQTQHVNDDGLDSHFSANYEIKKGRDFEVETLAKDCSGNITGIDLDMEADRSPAWPEYDHLRVKHSFPTESLAGSNIWNEEKGRIQLCLVIRLVVPAVGSNPKEVLTEEFNLIL